jgi:hypothetical protein
MALKRGLLGQTISIVLQNVKRLRALRIKLIIIVSAFIKSHTWIKLMPAKDKYPLSLPNEGEKAYHLFIKFCDADGDYEKFLLEQKELRPYQRKYYEKHHWQERYNAFYKPREVALSKQQLEDLQAQEMMREQIASSLLTDFLALRQKLSELVMRDEPANLKEMDNLVRIYAKLAEQLRISANLPSRTYAKEAQPIIPNVYVLDPD